MSTDRNSFIGKRAPDKYRPQLRLAAAVSALGMAMSMAPATVLSADTPPPGTGKPAVQAPAKGPVQPAAGHIKHGGVDGEVAPVRPPAGMQKQQPIESPNKDQTSADPAAQKQEQATKPGGPTYDLATSKK